MCERERGRERGEKANLQCRCCCESYSVVIPRLVSRCMCACIFACLYKFLYKYMSVFGFVCTGWFFFMFPFTLHKFPVGFVCLNTQTDRFRFHLDWVISKSCTNDGCGLLSLTAIGWWWWWWRWRVCVCVWFKFAVSHYDGTHTCERIEAQRNQPIQHYWMYHTGWKERVGGFGFSTIDFSFFLFLFICIWFGSEKYYYHYYFSKVSNFRFNKQNKNKIP